MPKGILERLADGPVLGDGGYLLELEKRGYVQAGPFTPEVVIEHPDALAQLHREFLRAGVDVLQTMTFYASDDKLATVGLEGKVDDINRNAVQIARQVAAEGDALVAGNLCLTWAYDPDGPGERRPRPRALRPAAPGPARRRRRRTSGSARRSRSSARRSCSSSARRPPGLPVMATMCFEQPVPVSYEGDSPADCARKLADAGADIVGVNCLNGPEQHAADRRRDARGGGRLRRGAAGRVPHHRRAAGLHGDGRTSRTSSTRCSSPARRWPTSRARPNEAGINYIGSCCGSVAGARPRDGARCSASSPAEEREWKSDDGQGDVGLRVPRALRDRGLIPRRATGASSTSPSSVSAASARAPRTGRRSAPAPGCSGSSGSSSATSAAPRRTTRGSSG